MMRLLRLRNPCYLLPVFPTIGQAEETSMDAQTLREGIFALNTRRFGSVTEVMIKRLGKLQDGRNQFHDLYDDIKRHRVEVKFSVASKKAKMPVREDNVLQCIEQAIDQNRMVPLARWREFEFDCNIQQVKRAEFDVLYYGLFFSDKVLIFSIESGEIGPQIYYSDKQHKGNVGEGQFHLNQDTLQIHLDRYLYKELTYEELLELLS